MTDVVPSATEYEPEPIEENPETDDTAPPPEPSEKAGRPGAGAA